MPDPGLFPFAGELQGALADGFAEGLVRREGGEPFGLRLALVSREVNQTQCIALRCRRETTAGSILDANRDFLGRRWDRQRDCDFWIEAFWNGTRPGIC